MQALSFEKKWRGYSMGYEGTPNKPVFILREQPRSCIAVNSVIKVLIEPKEHNINWDYQVRGSFMDKSCTINDRRGDVIAEVIKHKQCMQACKCNFIYVEKIVILDVNFNWV